MKNLPSLTGLVLLCLSPSALADFVTGTVVDANGAPVAGVNIDAIRRSNGNNINLSNDGTNGSGSFNTTIPADVYDLYFFPPAPPTTTHVTLVLRNVVVTGTKNLGTLHLQAGVSVSGHIQTQSGTPVAQVGLVMTDKATGFEVPLATRHTDAFGNFLVASPKNAIELALDATSVVSSVLASRRFDLAPITNTNLGTIVLPPGFRATGHVQRTAGGTAVATVDLDFNDVATGNKIYTPNDNTDSLGNFSVVVPAGSYDVEFAAPFATHLVGKRLDNRSISTNVALGTVALDPGVLLGGTVRSFSGAIQVNADVDVYLQSTEAPVVTVNDNTNASGVYQVIVPTGNLKVVFRPPSFTVPLASDVHTQFLVSGNASLDGALPACAGANNFGSGLAGTGGIVPHLTVSGGMPRSGNPDFAFELSGGRGGAHAVVVVSLVQNSQPFFGGTLLVGNSSGNSIKAFTILDGTPGAAGAGSKHMLFPSLGLVEGFDLFAQFFVRDPATARWAISDAVHFKVSP